MTKKHLHLFVAASLSLTVASSCMKKPELTEDDGTPISPQAVLENMAVAWGNADPSDIQIDESMSLDVTKQVQDLPKFYAVQHSQKAVSCSENSEWRQYIVAHKVREAPDANGNQKPEFEKLLGWKFAKSGLTAPAPLSILEDDGPGQLANLFVIYLSFAQTCFDDGVECFNLTSKTEYIDPPPAIAGKPNCSGLPGCKVKQNVVSFDVVSSRTINGTTVKSKERITTKVAVDYPFLARLAEFCIRGIEAAGGAAYMADVCFTVSDFQRGGSTTCSPLP